MAILELERSIVGYTDVGDGPPVLLLHGSASSRQQWRRLAARLASRHRVLVPDLHGYGETTMRSNHRVSLEDELAIVTALADRAGEPVHVVGHSYGGALALNAALDLGPGLASLALVEPAAFQLLRIAGEVDAWCEIDDIAQRHIGLAWERKLDECADVFMRYWIGASAWDAMPAQKRDSVIAAMPKVALEWLWNDQGAAVPATCARLKAPTLLVRGTRTRLAAHRVVDLLHRLLPHGTLVDVEGAGHMAPITHAEAVNTAIEAHLDRHGHRSLAATRAGMAS